MTSSWSCGKLLFLHWSIFWVLSHGQDCSSSQGFCQPSSNYCVDHRKSESEGCPSQHINGNIPFNLRSLPLGITECPRDSITRNYKPCLFQDSELSLSVPSDYSQELSATLQSIDVRYFGINVSWTPLNYSVRYQLLIHGYQEGSPIDCFCVSEDYNSNSFYIGSEMIDGIPYNHYDAHRNRLLTIELQVIVSDPQVNAPTTTFTRDWPDHCWNADFYYDVTCALPRYSVPSNITLLWRFDPASNLTLDVQWDYPTEWEYNITFVPPTIFYIDICVGDEDKCLHYYATNTSQVAFSDLNCSESYTVMVQPYVRCSGQPPIGCGRQGSEMISMCPTPSPTTSLSTTSPNASHTIDPDIGFTTDNTLSATASFPVTLVAASATAGCILLVILVLSIAMIVAAVYHRRPRPPFPQPISRPHPDSVVLVVYVPGDASEKDIQTYVVCRLHAYFDVVTPANLRGNVVEWMERNVHAAEAVLLVFTKRFHLEWENPQHVVVKAIRQLFTTAVARNTLDRYAIVVLDSGSRHTCIPDNEYLKGMNVYVLGENTNQADDLCRFITKSSRFEHAVASRSSATPSSSLSSCDEKSRCTESMDMSSLESQHGCYTLGQLDSPSSSQFDSQQQQLMAVLLPQDSSQA